MIDLCRYLHYFYNPCYSEVVYGFLHWPSHSRWMVPGTYNDDMECDGRALYSKWDSTAIQAAELAKRADILSAELLAWHAESAVDTYFVDDLADTLKVEEKDIPTIANIDAAILAAIDAGGKLDMTSWHGPTDRWCGTTHCRAGWAIHLAGKKGKNLENRFGPQIAGTLIYQASRPDKPAPHFFAAPEDALADIRACAAEQAGDGTGRG